MVRERPSLYFLVVELIVTRKLKPLLIFPNKAEAVMFCWASSSLPARRNTNFHPDRAPPFLSAMKMIPTSPALPNCWLSSLSTRRRCQSCNCKFSQTAPTKIFKVTNSPGLACFIFLFLQKYFYEILIDIYVFTLAIFLPIWTGLLRQWSASSRINFIFDDGSM